MENETIEVLSSDNQQTGVLKAAVRYANTALLCLGLYGLWQGAWLFRHGYVWLSLLPFSFGLTQIIVSRLSSWKARLIGIFLLFAFTATMYLIN